MTNANAVRGHRVGAGPMGEPDHGKAAPCIRVSFWCADRHETRLRFAVDAAIPETWDCPRCGRSAGQNEQDPPVRPRAEPYKTHLAYVKERRSAADGEAILAEALARRRGTASTPAPAPLHAATSREDSHPAEQPPPPARRRSPARRGPAAVTGDRPRPGRRPADASAPARPPRRPATNPDPAAAGAPSARLATTRTPAMSSPGNAEPEPVGCPRCRPDGCKGCGYRPGNCTCPGGPRSQL